MKKKEDIRNHLVMMKISVKSSKMEFHLMIMMMMMWICPVKRQKKRRKQLRSLQ